MAWSLFCCVYSTATEARRVTSPWVGLQSLPDVSPGKQSDSTAPLSLTPPLGIRVKFPVNSLPFILAFCEHPGLTVSASCVISSSKTFGPHVCTEHAHAHTRRCGHTQMYTWAHACTHTDTGTCTQTHRHGRTDMGTHTHADMGTHTQTHRHGHTHTQTRAHTRRRGHTHTRRRGHTHTDVGTHTHTHLPSPHRPSPFSLPGLLSGSWLQTPRDLVIHRELWVLGQFSGCALREFWVRPRLISLSVPGRHVQGSVWDRFSVTVCQPIDGGSHLRTPPRGSGKSGRRGEARSVPSEGLPALGVGSHFSSACLYNEVRCWLKIQVLEIFFTWTGAELLRTFFGETTETLLVSRMSQLSIFTTGASWSAYIY